MGKLYESLFRSHSGRRSCKRLQRRPERYLRSPFTSTRETNVLAEHINRSQNVSGTRCEAGQVPAGNVDRPRTSVWAYHPAAASNLKPLSSLTSCPGKKRFQRRFEACPKRCEARLTRFQRRFEACLKHCEARLTCFEALRDALPGPASCCENRGAASVCVRPKQRALRLLL